MKKLTYNKFLEIVEDLPIIEVDTAKISDVFKIIREHCEGYDVELYFSWGVNEFPSFLAENNKTNGFSFFVFSRGSVFVIPQTKLKFTEPVEKEKKSWKDYLPF